MRNREAGYLIIGVALLIGVIILLFNRGMVDIVNAACSHGTSCTMWGTIRLQTSISIAILCFVTAIGLYFVFFKEDERKAKPRKATKSKYKEVLKELSKDEKTALKKVIKSGGAIFQSELVESTGLSKVKITRVLDKLEGKNLVERRRRGMTNVVILKH